MLRRGHFSTVPILEVCVTWNFKLALDELIYVSPLKTLKGCLSRFQEVLHKFSQLSLLEKVIVEKVAADIL